jgi:hypothetical protein
MGASKRAMLQPWPHLSGMLYLSKATRSPVKKHTSSVHYAKS